MQTESQINVLKNRVAELSGCLEFADRRIHREQVGLSSGAAPSDESPAFKAALMDSVSFG